MYSKEHQTYLKKIKQFNLLVKITQITIIIILLTTWQLLADHNIINTFITSSPKEILNTIINLHQTNNLYHHIWITIYETVISFTIGTILGYIIASILWWNKFIAKVSDPYLTILNSLPKVALGPIIIIWAGAGINSIILMALLISVIITVINVYQGFNETDINKIKLMQSFKARKKQIYFKLILPNSTATMINALKINVSMSLIGLLPPVGENLNSNKYYSKYLSHYL